jgi:methylated-DNA-[protein]-cysteine S-methyltransferase
VDRAVQELSAYFAGELRTFTVPLDLVGTSFQHRVWAAVTEVSYGTTATYREIAQRLGAPRSFRAVGAANGANPAAIIVPCHRLIGTAGDLRGYAGGLNQKRALLDLEGAAGAADTTYP